MQAIATFKKERLDELVAQLQEPQRGKFNRIFPNGVKPDQYEHAVLLCERTIAKNENEPANK